MADDVDMDAPQISTLREETTPEPNPAKSTKFRVKLLVNDKAEGSRAGSISSKHGRAESDDEDDEEDEDEEDQLIDDDEEEAPKPPPVALPPVQVPPPRGTPGKRGGRGSRGGRRGRGGGRGGASHVTGTQQQWLTCGTSGAPTVPDTRPESLDPSGVAGESVLAPVRKKPGPAKGSQRGMRKKQSKYVRLVFTLSRD